MKKKRESTWEEIIRYYGSLEVYIEEQRRCALVTLETAFWTNPITQPIQLEEALPVEMVEGKPENRFFWLKFLRLKK